MSKLLKLLLGLILFFLFGYWCIYEKSAPKIQNDIKSRALKALHTSGYNSIQLNVDGRDLVLSGSVTEQNMRSAIEQTIRVEGVRKIENQLIVDDSGLQKNYFLSVKKDNLKGIQLDGFIPDALTHHNFLSYVIETLKGTSLIDNLVERSEPPPNWVGISQSGIQALKDLETGQLNISGRQLSLSGTIASKKLRNKIIGNLAQQLPAGIKSNTQLTVSSDINVPKKPVKPDTSTIAACQNQLNKLHLNENITFKSGSAQILSSSYPALKKIITLKKSCPNTTLYIKGHTDATGSKKFNQQLSQKRANAVKNHLVQLGIESKLMDTKGFGEEQPIADNQTWAGRQKNRRIEITIKEYNE